MATVSQFAAPSGPARPHSDLRMTPLLWTPPGPTSVATVSHFAAPWDGEASLSLAYEVTPSTTKEWARAVLQWDPGRDAQTQTQRRVGRPKTRWWDDVLRHAQQMAGDPPKTPTDLLVCAATEEWEILKKGFIEQ